MPVPSNLVQRDQGNVKKASGISGEYRFEQSAIQVGAFQVDPRSRHYSEMRRKSREGIFHNPFDVMVEVEVEFRNGDEKSFVWYGNERVEVNAPLTGAGAPIVLAWTHPGLQAALAADLTDQEDLFTSGLTINPIFPRDVEIRSKQSGQAQRLLKGDFRTP